MWRFAEAKPRRNFYCGIIQSSRVTRGIGRKPLSLSRGSALRAQILEYHLSFTSFHLLSLLLEIVDKLQQLLSRALCQLIFWWSKDFLQDWFELWRE